MNTIPRILAVCTGNICRSPAMERLLGRQLSSSALVRSAGTMALVGAPIAAPMAELLESVNVSASGFEARRLTRPMIDEADLVLTASTEHRSEVVALQPLAMKKTFTLLEFARNALHANPSIARLPLAERVPALSRHVLHARPRMRLAPDQIDIPDPYGHGEETYRASFALICQAVAQIAPILATWQE